MNVAQVPANFSNDYWPPFDRGMTWRRPARLPQKRQASRLSPRERTRFPTHVDEFLRNSNSAVSEKLPYVLAATAGSAYFSKGDTRGQIFVGGRGSRVESQQTGSEPVGAQGQRSSRGWETCGREHVRGRETRAQQSRRMGSPRSGNPSTLLHLTHTPSTHLQTKHSHLPTADHILLTAHNGETTTTANRSPGQPAHASTDSRGDNPGSVSCPLRRGTCVRNTVVARHPVHAWRIDWLNRELPFHRRQDRTS